MLLSDLLIHLEIDLKISDDVNFKRVCLNHRFVYQETIFLALSGKETHGAKYVKQAIEKGAPAIFLEDENLGENEYVLDSSLTVPCIKGQNFSQHLVRIANLVYSFDPKSIKLIGITGTNGKTSTIYYTAQLMQLEGLKPYIISTIGSGLLGQLANYKGTTPDIFSLYEHIALAIHLNCDAVLIEVSSHGIDQNRIGDLVFDVAVLMSLDNEHLDYHDSYQQYVETKFEILQKKRARNRLVNFDLPEVKSWYENQLTGKDILSFSMNESEDEARRFDHKLHMTIKKVMLKPHGIFSTTYLYLPKCRFDYVQFAVNLYGLFQMQSVMAANLILYALGIHYQNIPEDLTDVLKTVPGRMQLIEDQNLSKVKVFVDYAHTPKALENALLSVKKHFPSRYLIVVFGCGGERYSDKRSKMGCIACELANYIILTDDNPRSEDPKAITNDIQSGIEDKKKFSIIHDREHAIEKGMQLGYDEPRKDAVILIAGRGHETIQSYQSGDRYLDDYKFALGLLQELAK